MPHFLPDGVDSYLQALEADYQTMFDELQRQIAAAGDRQERQQFKKRRRELKEELAAKKRATRWSLFSNG